MLESPPSKPTPHEEFFDQLGLQYEEAFGHDAGLHKIVQRFLTLLPPNAHVLDCGCGTGKPVSHMIASTGHLVHGIDRSQTMVELSRKQVPTGTFEKVDMLHYAPSEDKLFSGIVATFSLFVLTREEITIMASKWFQWLQPNGFLLIGVLGAEDVGTTRPEMYDADGECARGIEETFMNAKQLVTLFTKAGWNGLLEGAGFQIVHTEQDLFRPPKAAVCDDELHYFVIARKPDI